MNLAVSDITKQLDSMAHKVKKGDVATPKGNRVSLFPFGACIGFRLQLFRKPIHATEIFPAFDIAEKVNLYLETVLPSEFLFHANKVAHAPKKERKKNRI